MQENEVIFKKKCSIKTSLKQNLELQQAGLLKFLFNLEKDSEADNSSNEISEDFKKYLNKKLFMNYEFFKKYLVKSEEY